MISPIRSNRTNAIKLSAIASTTLSSRASIYRGVVQGEEIGEDARTIARHWASEESGARGKFMSIGLANLLLAIIAAEGAFIGHVAVRDISAFTK